MTMMKDIEYSEYSESSEAEVNRMSATSNTNTTMTTSTSSTAAAVPTAVPAAAGDGSNNGRAEQRFAVRSRSTSTISKQPNNTVTTQSSSTGSTITVNGIDANDDSSNMNQYTGDDNSNNYGKQTLTMMQNQQQQRRQMKPHLLLRRRTSTSGSSNTSKRRYVADATTTIQLCLVCIAILILVSIGICCRYILSNHENDFTNDSKYYDNALIKNSSFSFERQHKQLPFLPSLSALQNRMQLLRGTVIPLASMSDYILKTQRDSIDSTISSSTRTILPGKEDMIDMRIINFELQYQNIDGGVWKQGFDIQVDPVQMVGTDETKEKESDEMLQIFVVPHSHCDPGWIQTFDAYFQQQTSLIITTVIESLLKDARRTFIWAEISYFSWWYEIQNETMQQHVHTLLENGQLEFVTGGWVQPDEANSELYAMEMQLQEGHDWIKHHLGNQYIPQFGWAIDPFGYSPTAAYLWKQYNFSGIVIQRVHYEIKKIFARQKHLEFFWRQTWEDDTSIAKANTKTIDPFNGQSIQAHDIFTHVMPFYSYDLPHTCGPDPSICCQFDFARTSSISVMNGMNEESTLSCPWSPQAQVITMENIKERALLLLDQYRKKATLYRSNAVLIPIGDDFRYQSIAEAESQYTNYQLLFDYINANVRNVHVRFGTLSEYFKAARRTFHGPVPIVKGSFFTYSDRDQDYWSGYFTSRAFDKALDRQLERVLYVAESLNGTRAELQQPRRALSLFQHHDGVTGTAKNVVVDDYALSMYNAINTTYNFILHKFGSHIQSLFVKHSGSSSISIEEIRPCWISSAPRNMMQNLCRNTRMNDKTTTGIVVYNPLLQYSQYCGDKVIPPKEWAYVTLPCEIPGPMTANDRTPTKFVFDPKTGLMLEPIREEWKVWQVNQGGAYLFVPHALVDYGTTAHDVVIENGGYIVRTKNWSRTVVERKIPSDSAATAIIDFIYETYLLEDNQEWLVRFSSGSSSSSIHNDGYFYTDLNGFNFDTHRFRSDMPIQSQIYPMPTLASIQDENFRLTVLSEHAQGTGSLIDGSIDVWLDRRLRQDDNRGLDQGINDNRPIRTRFRVVLEPRQNNKEFLLTGTLNDKLEYNISSSVRRMWDELQHPLVMFGKHLSSHADFIDAII